MSGGVPKLIVTDQADRNGVRFALTASQAASTTNDRDTKRRFHGDTLTHDLEVEDALFPPGGAAEEVEPARRNQVVTIPSRAAPPAASYASPMPSRLAPRTSRGAEVEPDDGFEDGFDPRASHTPQQLKRIRDRSNLLGSAMTTPTRSTSESPIDFDLRASHTPQQLRRHRDRELAVQRGSGGVGGVGSRRGTPFRVTGAESTAAKRAERKAYTRGPVTALTPLCESDEDVFDDGFDPRASHTPQVCATAISLACTSG